MEKLTKLILVPLFWILILMFILFYPMFISIYVFLPLLIGVMGYVFIVGIEKNNLLYVFIGLIYFFNLEVNLSLPFFLMSLVSLLVYVLFYRNFDFIKKCPLCRSVITVLLVDFIYLGALLSYDFIFQTQSIVLDTILLYSLVVDILMVVLL